MSEAENGRALWLFKSLLGLAMGWFTLAGGIGALVLLRWIGIAQTVASTVAPLGTAGQAVLGVATTLVNFVLLSMLLEIYADFGGVL